MKRVEDAKELVRRRIHTYQRKKRKYDRKEDKMTNNGRQNTTHQEIYADFYYLQIVKKKEGEGVYS
jgi:hypothetical protein